ncbi:alpha/beta fold hydrolase [Pannonibacter phragmitetus]|uniref:alpha/beta fold hydrolase n=1 Tax=Pannonibacter phragmitetus TaxID=121719 RepID=UPI000F043A83|nr:alpha/beta hydrolase [Pannonibacter phragmitetus]
MSVQDVSRKYAVTLRGKGGVPIVFAHGLGCDQTMWKDVAPAFEASSQVILFDLIGFGNSDHSCFSYERYQSLADYADDSIELIEHVCSEPVIFVGHSVSAMIGVLAAGKRPDLFRQLVLIGPSPCYVNDGAYQGGFNAADIEGLIEAMRSNYLGWTKGIAPLIMGNPERPELTAVLEESFCRTDPDVAQHFAALTFWSDNRNDLASVTTPALVIQCSDDVIAPQTAGRYVATQMPNAQFVELKVTGHCPHVSHPAEVIEEIRCYAGLPIPLS